MDELVQFKFDRLRQLAVVGLQPAHAGDLQRLLKVAVFGPEFQLLVAETNDGEYRGILIEKISEFVGNFDLPSTRFQLDATLHSDVAAMEQKLEALAKDFKLIHIEGGDFWFDIPRWQALNVRREAIAEATQARLVFWLSTEQIRLFATNALDCWAWRTGVFSFLKQLPASPLLQFKGDLPIIDKQSLSQKTARLAQLQEMVNTAAEPEIQIRLLDEMIAIYLEIGEHMKALHVLTHQKWPLFKSGFENADRYIVSYLTQGVSIMLQMGQFANALTTIQSDILPRLEKSSHPAEWIDVHEILAEVLVTQEKPGEALRILQGEVLPLVQERKEMHRTLHVQKAIAKAMLASGQIEQALVLLQKEVLPTAIAMDDLPLIADVQLQIALVLEVKREYESAVRLLQLDVKPVYFKLRMQTELIRTQLEIARILRLQGNAEEAGLQLIDVFSLINPSDIRSLCDLFLEFELCSKELGNPPELMRLMENFGAPLRELSSEMELPKAVQDSLQRVLSITEIINQSSANPVMAKSTIVSES